MTAAHEGLEPWEIEGLQTARRLAELGVRLFVAPPDWQPGHRLGFQLPPRWEQVASADPAVVDAWQPGWALCAVGDGPVSFIDLDPQPGQDPAELARGLADAQLLPNIYGIAHTPSGGQHLLVAGLDAPKTENVIPGVDVRAGYHDGSSAGFVFLSPTRRSRKDDRSGPRYPYRWDGPFQIDPAQLAADRTGEPLAQRLRAGRQREQVQQPPERSPLPETAGLAARLMNGDLTGSQVVRTPEQGWAAVQAAGQRVLDCVEHGGAHEAVRDFAWEVARFTQGGLMDYTQAQEHYAAVVTARWPAGPDDGDWLAWSSAWAKLGREDPSQRVKVMTQAEIEANQRAAQMTQPGAGVAPQGPAPGTYEAGSPGAALDWLRSKLVDAAGLKNMPKPEPLVEGLIFCDTLSWLIGAPGSGKSFVAVDLACSIATGTPWQGRRVAQGPVLYLLAEGATGTGQRVDAWEDLHRTTADGVYFLTYPVQLAAGGQLVAPFQQLVAEMRPRLVIVDTQARTSVGVDENSAKDVGQLIGNLDGIRTASPETSVLVLHHTPRGSSNPRGSTSIEGAADTILLAEKDAVLVTLKNTKQKDAPEAPDLSLTLMPRRSSAVLESAGLVRVEVPAAAEALYTEMLAKGGVWSMTQILDELGASRSTAQRYLKVLETRGMIRATRDSSRWLYTALVAPNTPTHSVPGQAPSVYVRTAHEGGGHPWAPPAQSAPLPTGAHEGAHDKTAGQSGVPTGAHEGAHTESKVPTDRAPSLEGPSLARTTPGQNEKSLSEELEEGPPDRLVSEDSAPSAAPPPPDTPQAGPREKSQKVTKAKADPKPGTKAHARAEAKRQAIVDAAGPDVPLPAAVVRDTSPLEPGSVSVYPTDLEMAAEVLATMPVLTVDVETSGYPVGHELYELRTVQLGDANIGVVLDPRDEAQCLFIRETLERAPRLRAHSATADTVPLAVAELADFDGMWERMDDTVIPAKLNDPDSTGSDPSLKKIAEHVLGADAVSTPAEAAKDDLFAKAGWLKEPKLTTPPERNGWYQVRKTSTTMIKYAGSDVLDTARVSDLLPPLPTWLAERERVVAHMVARVAFHGVPIDGPLVDRLLTEHSTAREGLSERIRDRYGIDNPGSAQQVSRALLGAGVELPRTKPSKTHPDGQPSVKEGVLEALKGQYSGETDELITDVLQYRHHNTAIGLFLEPYHERVHRGDGRARPTVYTLGADTGRMSCVRPNFQQLPREGGIRAIIATDPGMLQIGADFSSVELRVAADVSGDLVLKRMLDDGIDPHAMAAELVFGPQWTKEQRYMVKRGVFGRIYGGGLNTLAEQMGVPHWVAQKLIDAIDTLWPTLSAWAKSITAAVQSGMMPTYTTYSGRIVHLPRNKAHAAPNYIIQGTARELLMDALLLWRDTPWGSSVMWPVHDEVDAHVPADQAEEATATLVRCMETTLPSGVRIVAEPSEPSPFWRDAS